LSQIFNRYQTAFIGSSCSSNAHILLPKKRTHQQNCF